MFKFFLIVLFLTPSVWAQTNSELEIVANSKEWHRLMHYKKRLGGGIKSEVDGAGFFFAQDGQTNSLAELRASLQAIDENPIVGKLEQPMHCAFPERTRFLVEKFELRKQITPIEDCAYYSRYLDLFNDPKSTTIVFSSAYPNNSASMFGHTFLKINSGRGSELLDAGINFAAAVSDDENPFAFVWFGLTGGYAGQWSFQPYYVKVHEYVNFESRDLWEYELTLSQEETLRLLAHIWEIEANSFFRYYFFDKNCSYQVLAAIEAIRPDWEISYHHINMIPGESIKNIVFEEGVVKEVTYRPSHYNKMWTRYKNLSTQEKTDFHLVLKSQKEVEALESRLALDALTSYLTYLKEETPKAYERKYADIQTRALLSRAKLGVLTSEEIEKQRVPEAKNRPDWGHDPIALDIGGGVRDLDGIRQDFGRIRLKSSYHNFLNKDLGYSKYNHIDFPSVEFQMNSDDQDFRLEELILLSTTSIMPVNALRSPVSYRGAAYLRTAREYFGCSDCYEFNGEGGLGYSYSLFDDRIRVYGFLNGQIGLGEHLNRGYDLAFGPEVGLLSTLHEDYKIWLNYRSFCSVIHSDRCLNFHYASFSQSYSLARNWEIHNINRWVISDDKFGPQNYELALNLVYLFR